MNRYTRYRLLFCIAACAFFLYRLVDDQNQITKVEMLLPRLISEVEEIREKNAQLKLRVEQMENPLALLQMAKKKEYSDLVEVVETDVLYLPEPPSPT